MNKKIYIIVLAMSVAVVGIVATCWCIVTQSYNEQTVAINDKSGDELLTHLVSTEIHPKSSLSMYKATHPKTKENGVIAKMLPKITELEWHDRLQESFENTIDPEIQDPDVHRRIAATMRIGLDNANVLTEMVNDENANVRNTAVERLTQLEFEREQTEEPRVAGQPGRFLPIAIQGFAEEADMTTLSSRLEYIGLFGENNMDAKVAIDSVLERSDIEPPMLATIHEILIENYGQTPAAAEQAILATPSSTNLSNETIEMILGSTQQED